MVLQVVLQCFLWCFIWFCSRVSCGFVIVFVRFHGVLHEWFLRGFMGFCDDFCRIPGFMQFCSVCFCGVSCGFVVFLWSFCYGFHEFFVVVLVGFH